MNEITKRLYIIEGTLRAALRPENGGISFIEDEGLTGWSCHSLLKVTREAIAECNARADLCEKTISDQSASHITLETLVEELGEVFEAARDQLLEEASSCETLNLTVEYTKKHIDPLNVALSKLDAWRNK